MVHITTSTSTTDILCMLVILATALAIAVLTIVHFLPTGVNPVSEAVSDYGVGEYKNFYRLAAFWLGAAGLLLAIALAQAVFPKPTLTILTLLVFAAVRWTITLFPTDLPGDEPSSVGRSHVVLAVAAFAAIAIAAATFPAVVDSDPFWTPHETLLRALGIAVTAAAIATGLSRKLLATRFFGVFERLLYLAMAAWLITVAVLLTA